MGGKRLVIRDDISPTELRKRARQEPDRTAAARMQAIANALEGMTRAEAARLAGMERQALHDAVGRYNAEGLDGLHDRPRPGAKPRLDEEQMKQLRQVVLDGPDAEETGLSAWTLADRGTANYVTILRELPRASCLIGYTGGRSQTTSLCRGANGRNICGRPGDRSLNSSRTKMSRAKLIMSACVCYCGRIA